MSRQRISSVPLGAVLAALALIAVVALFALYLGADTVLIGVFDDSDMAMEIINH
jgi:hypothetical protein